MIGQETYTPLKQSIARLEHAATLLFAVYCRVEELSHVNILIWDGSFVIISFVLIAFCRAFDFSFTTLVWKAFYS